MYVNQILSNDIYIYKSNLRINRTVNIFFRIRLKKSLEHRAHLLRRWPEYSSLVALKLSTMHPKVIETFTIV